MCFGPLKPQRPASPSRVSASPLGVRRRFGSGLCPLRPAYYDGLNCGLGVRLVICDSSCYTIRHAA